MNKIIEIIDEIYTEVKTLNEGKVADYIPELANVSPDKFAISICFVDGTTHNIGDTKDSFCLQSCSKPLSYCAAHDEMGKDELHKRVGFEPSGQAFNAFILNKKGLPHNPMINAGAIMVASQIGKNEEPSHRFNILKKKYSEFAGGNKVGFDNSVFLSEQHHADRNISLAYYMRENGAYSDIMSPNDISQGLNLYYQQCSITINSEAGAQISGTLANGGVNPTTNTRVSSIESISDCLTLMYSCGMYDYSGQFAFEIGLPAKSGVSGCILLVIPNQMGICIWSPPLDDVGNSFKGIEVCKRLNNKLKLHIFHNIITNGINFNDSINTRFLNLCCKGDVNAVRLLLPDVDINVSDYDGRTGLHLAEAEGHMEVFNLLLDNGANITKDRWGNEVKQPTQTVGDDDTSK